MNVRIEECRSPSGYPRGVGHHFLEHREPPAKVRRDLCTRIDLFTAADKHICDAFIKVQLPAGGENTSQFAPGQRSGNNGLVAHIGSRESARGCISD